MPSTRRADARTAAAPHLQGIELDEAAFMRSLITAMQALEIRSVENLWTLGLMVQNQARLLCPVDTGRLRSSIQATREDGGRTVVIHTNVHYAVYVEFGTRHMSAQPYLRPAMAIAVSRAAGVLGQGAG